MNNVSGAVVSKVNMTELLARFPYGSVEEATRVTGPSGRDSMPAVKSSTQLPDALAVVVKTTSLSSNETSTVEKGSVAPVAKKSKLLKLRTLPLAGEVMVTKLDRSRITVSESPTNPVEFTKLICNEPSEKADKSRVALRIPATLVPVAIVFP